MRSTTSSFTDASADLVKAFNREHRGRIHLKLIRGPLNTESISDLAISSLLLGDAPFDALLMDVTWLPKYAAAGWLDKDVPIRKSQRPRSAPSRGAYAARTRAHAERGGERTPP